MGLQIDVNREPALAEAMRVGKHVVLTPNGLKRYPDLGAVIRRAGVDQQDEWLYEATAEALMLLDAGTTGNELVREVTNHMARVIRAEAQHQGHASLDACPEGMLTAPSAEDVALAALDAERKQLEADLLWLRLRELMTIRQWEQLTAYAETGSATQAAELSGSTKNNVLRTLRTIRKKVEDAALAEEEVVRPWME